MLLNEGTIQKAFYLENHNLEGLSNQDYTLLEISYFQKYFVASEPSISYQSKCKKQKF